MLVFPGILLFVGFILIPIIVSVYFGMTDMNFNINESQFIGFANYQEILFHDSTFWRSLLNAIYLALATVFIQHPLAIFFAILLMHSGKWEKLLRIIYFIPAVLSVVVTSKMWVSILSPQYGLFKQLAESSGLSFLKQNFLGDPSIAIWSIIFVCMWQGFGYALLLYYAGLQRVPKDYIEAARIDGAGQFQTYRYVVLPMIIPIINTLIILAVITCLKTMETIFLMTNGGPGDSTQFLAYYLYTEGWTKSLYSYGNAVSVLFVILALLVTLMLNRIIQRDVGEF